MKSTATVGGMTFVSRILGLVRDVVFARFIGAGLGADAFFVAFKIPNFLRRLFAEGAFSQAFVPVLSEYQSQKSHEEVQMLVNSVSGVLARTLFFVTLAGVLAAPIVVMVTAPGFIEHEEKFELTAQMLRITFPYLLFISLTALAGGILNTYGNFAVPAFTPVFLNICLIVAAVFVAPYIDQPVLALAWGVFIAGIVQLIFQLPYLGRIGLLPRLRFNRDHEGVQRIRKLMMPALFGTSVVQINLLFDTLIASFLVTGSVSWLYFSDRLVEFPLGVFGIALATVILPSLSRKHAQSSSEEFSRTLDWALRMVVLIGLPASVGLFLLASPMLTTLFLYGEFGIHDMQMATYSLCAYSTGLLGFILVKVLAPGFYARQDTRTPVRVGIVAMLANMILNVLFVVPMVLGDIKAPHAGLALATAVSSFLNAFLLFRILKQQRIYRALPGWGVWLTRILAACTMMGLALHFGVEDIGSWLGWNWFERVWHLALWVIIGIVVYIVVLLLLGLRPRHCRTVPLE